MSRRYPQNYPRRNINNALPIRSYPPQRRFPRQYPPPQQESNKKIWIFVGIFAVVVIALSIFFFIKYSSNTISDDELLAGTYIELNEDKEVKFKLGEEEHKIIIDSVSDDSIDIIIQSETITATLNVGETKKFDLDSNGVDDLSIKLRSIVDGKANLFIKEISDVICEEDWNCTDWSNCVNDIQTRSCNDLNSCGTVDNKPEEEQGCEGSVEVELNCLEQNGTICSQTETCSGTLINSSDSNVCCFGDCIGDIDESESCSDKGLYDYIEGGKGQCIFPGVITIPFYNNQSIFCCSIPLTYPLELSDELRNVWNSIQNFGDCTDFVSKLESCSPYKCSFIHPLTQETMEKGVIGESGGKCHSLEEMPNNGEQYCQYNDSQLAEMVDYYTFYEEQCAVSCSIVQNETGYFINDILTENVLQNMYDSGDCSATFG